MPKARLNEYQFNVKQTKTEWNQLQGVNKKYFNGSLNNSELGRFLIKVALDALQNATVEKKTVYMVNGLPITAEDLK